MRKIIVVGSMLGLTAIRAMAQEIKRVDNIEIVIGTECTQLEIKPLPPVSVVENDPLPYYGYGRKGKGEKKRAASQRFKKGWG